MTFYLSQETSKKPNKCSPYHDIGTNDIHACDELFGPDGTEDRREKTAKRRVHAADAPFVVQAWRSFLDPRIRETVKEIVDNGE